MQAIFAEQLGPAIARLCEGSATASTRAGLIASQALGLALCRYVLRLPPVAAMERAEVIGWLGPTFQRYLTGNPK
jgi:Tetracyclin repressor-like, C-terminal domain